MKRLFAPIQRKAIAAAFFGPRRYALARLDICLSNAVAMRFAIPVAASVLAVAFAHWSTWQAGLVWAGVGALYLVVFVAVVPRRLRHLIAKGRLNDAYGFAAAMAATGFAILASVGIWLWLPGNDANNITIISVLSIGAWAAAILLGPCPPLFAAALAPIALVMLMRVMDERFFIESIQFWLAVAYLLFAVTIAGAMRRIVDHSVKLSDENGELAMSLASEAEEAQQARRKAENQSRMRSRFLAAMNHDLRSPLNAILGFSEIIRDQTLGNATKTYQGYAADIHASGAHLLALITDILEYSRIEAGQLELSATALKLQDVFEDMLSQFELRAKEAGITLLVEHSRDFPRLWADERALRQILGGLIGQALRATRRGGHVALSAGLDPEGRIVLTVAYSSPSDGKSQDKSRKNEGLGLPIVRSLLELHNGELGFGEAGNATSMHVAFPPERLVPADCAFVN